jgi:hypothetical protein
VVGGEGGRCWMRMKWCMGKRGVGCCKVYKDMHRFIAAYRRHIHI